MRQLKIKSQTEILYLNDVPDEFKFIVDIAKQYANTKLELEKYYKVGIKALEDLKTETTDEYFKKTTLWVVRQTIIKENQKKQHSSYPT